MFTLIVCVHYCTLFENSKYYLTAADIQSLFFVKLKKKIEILVICFPYDWRPGAHLFVFFDDEREEPNKRCNNLITTTYENDNDNT